MYPKRLSVEMPSIEHLGLTGMSNLGKQPEVKRLELGIEECRRHSLA